MRAPRPLNSELATLRRIKSRQTVSLVITFDEATEMVLSSTVMSQTDMGLMESVQIGHDLAIMLASSLVLTCSGDGIAVFSK